MSAHTPGPWKVEQDGLDERWRVYSAFYSDEQPGICGAYDKHWPLTEPDARLIAAAPALLEALEIAERDLAAMSPSFGYEYTSLATVRAAIAQAKGDA